MLNVSLKQLKPKVLLSADKYRSAGKDIDIIPKIHQVAVHLQKIGLEHLILVGQLEKDRRPTGPLPKLVGVNILGYPDLLDKHARVIDFCRGPSNAPLWVLFSSGTSKHICVLNTPRLLPIPAESLAGKPKPIMHGQLAMVFAQKQGSLLHGSLKPGDRHMQITTTGWMMW